MTNRITKIAVIGREKDGSGKITYTKYGKKKRYLYDPNSNNVIDAKLFIDIEKGLPIGMKLKIGRNGTVAQYTDITFEYPENGPKDIYELCVPKSATVVYGKPPTFKCKTKCKIKR